MNFNLTDVEEKFLKQYAKVFESERDCDLIMGKELLENE
jgi:hypothetical protein